MQGVKKSDFSQSKKNISAFLEHSKDVEGSLRVPSYIPSGSSGKRRSPERSQHSSGKRRGDYDDSFELNASASAGSGSKKKPKSSSSKNIGKSKGSKKSTTSSSSNSKIIYTRMRTRCTFPYGYMTKRSS